MPLAVARTRPLAPMRTTRMTDEVSTMRDEDEDQVDDDGRLSIFRCVHASLYEALSLRPLAGR